MKFDIKDEEQSSSLCYYYTMYEYISKSVDDTKKIAEQIASSLIEEKRQKALIVGLYGNLGAGKTTFTKYFGNFLDIKEMIQSPTFVIQKIYKINKNQFKNFIHIDAYRIEKDSEMLNIGWNEIIQKKENLIFIEWPENILNIINDHIKIFFEHISENERKIIYKNDR